MDQTELETTLREQISAAQAGIPQNIKIKTAGLAWSRYNDCFSYSVVVGGVGEPGDTLGAGYDADIHRATMKAIAHRDESINALRAKAQTKTSAELAVEELE